MGLESIASYTQCPCCQVNNEYNALKDFQKIIELKKAGIVVYRHKAVSDDFETNGLSIAPNTDQDIFIVYNTKDVEIRSADIVPEIEQNDVSCPRCRYFIEHAKRLLQDMSVIDKKDITAICNYCRKKNLSRQTFCKCQDIGNKFAASILKYKDGKTEEVHKMKTQKEIKSLLNKVLMENKQQKKKKSLSTSNLIKAKHSPISVHVPDVGNIFEPSSLTVKTHLMEDNVQVQKAIKKRDSKPTVRVNIDGEVKQKTPEGAPYVKTEGAASVVYSDKELKSCLVKPRRHADEPFLTYEKELEIQKSIEILKPPSEESFFTAVTTKYLAKKGFSYIFPTNIRGKKERSKKNASKKQVSSSELIKNIHEKIEQQEILKKKEEERMKIQDEEKKRKSEEKKIKRAEKDQKRQEYEKQKEEQEAEKRALLEKQSTSRLESKPSKVDKDILATDTQQIGKDGKETEKKGLKKKETEIKEKDRSDEGDSKEKGDKQKGKEVLEKDKKEQMPKEKREQFTKETKDGLPKEKKIGKKDQQDISANQKYKQKTNDEKESKKKSKQENEADLLKEKEDDAIKREALKKVKKTTDKERMRESNDIEAKDKQNTQSEKEPKDKSGGHEAEILKKTLDAQAKDKDAADKMEQDIKSKRTENEGKAQKTTPKSDTQTERKKSATGKTSVQSEKEPKDKSKDNEAEILKKGSAAQAKDKEKSGTEKASRQSEMEPKDKSKDNEAEILKKGLAGKAKDKEDSSKSKGADKEGKVQKTATKSETQPDKRKSEKEPTKKDLKSTDFKMKPSSGYDLISNLVRMKREEKREKPLEKIQSLPKVPIHSKTRKKKTQTSDICNMSDLELDLESSKHKKKKNFEMGEIILGQEVVKKRLGLIEKGEMVPEVKFAEEASKPSEVAPEKRIEPEKPQLKGVIRYTLSDRSFIDKGWTVLPCEKVVRKMNIYKMRQSKPEFDWFERNKKKGSMFYDTGERMAEFQDDGRCRWYYKNGKVALDYYDTEDANAQKRFVVYSKGEKDERDSAQPSTVLATFDYLGNGMVFDNNGKTRLKYNQTEGTVLDREIGPASTWKWHSLNEPPVLQQVMIDTQLDRKDAEIMNIGKDDAKKRPDNEEMLAIEFENFIKLKSKKILSQKFQPFEIRMKAFKINDNFSLRVMDQSTIYLVFRDGLTNVKLNIGMKLDHTEIVDTDTSDMGQVTVNVEDRPARTDSIAELQRSVGLAQQAERLRQEHERRLVGGVPLRTLSIDKLTAAITKPLRLTLQTIPLHSTASREICYPISRC